MTILKFDQSRRMTPADYSPIFSDISTSYNSKQNKYIKIEQNNFGDFISVSTTTDRNERSYLTTISKLVRKCTNDCENGTFTAAKNLPHLEIIFKTFKAITDGFHQKERGCLERLWYWIFGGNNQLQEAQKELKALEATYNYAKTQASY